MSEEHSKLKAIRTFRDDFAQANHDTTKPTATTSAAVESTSADPAAPVAKTPTTTPPAEPQLEIHPEAPLQPQPKPIEKTPPTPAPEPEPKSIGSIDDVVLTGAINNSDAPIEPVKNTDDVHLTSAGERVNLLETDNEIEQGSIITDRKRDRFHLFPAIWEAFLNWIDKERKERAQQTAKRDAAIPKVRKASERAEVIKKAAAGGIFANQADDLKITKAQTIKPKEVKKDEPEDKAFVTIKDKESVPEPSWSHFEDDKSAATTTQSEEAVEPIPAVESVPAPEPTPESESIPAPQPAPEPTPEPEPVPEPLPTIPEVVQPISQPTPIARSTAPSGPSSHWLSWTLITLVVLTAAGGGVAFTFWLANHYFADDAVTPTDNTRQALPNINTTQINSSSVIPLVNNRNGLLTDIKNTIPTGEGIVRFHNLVTTNDGTLATAEDILNILAINAPGSFIRTINTIRFGNHYAGTPIVVLYTNSFDAAFGGILEWEDSMLNNLDPLFASTDTATSTPTQFVDDVIQNTAVRVLRDNLGKDRLVYGFISQNIILITTESSVFSEILSNSSSITR